MELIMRLRRGVEVSEVGVVGVATMVPTEFITKQETAHRVLFT